MVESLPIYDVMNTISNKVFSLSQVDSGFTTVSLENFGSTFITKFRYVLVARPSTPTGPSVPTGLSYLYFIDRPWDQYESYQSKRPAMVYPGYSKPYQLHFVIPK